jgi:ABC-type polysaccharide/polyol phosphate transport system ATPase subunit
MSAIVFDCVSKRFMLHHERPRSFQELFLNLLRLKGRTRKEEYWALREVSFQIEPGEAIGIIGPNGAGKSTMLKLITRIIEPTSGQMQINGQVGALLELGAGFHPDLTGRENIYLNGSILGFSKTKMAHILDDILDFSEMRRFIDVPVKHYSSGMYMRLAFSIAIHTEPDILLVDEVLAVGDQAFQRRCLDKIEEMRRRGVTIILVTHDLGAVLRLCSRAMWLDEGRIQAEGAIERVIEQYRNRMYARDRAQAAAAGAKVIGAERSEGLVESHGAESSWRWGSREAEIVNVQILDHSDAEQSIFQTGDTLKVRIHYVAHEPIQKPMFGLAFHHSTGFHISGPNNVFSDYPIPEIDGRGSVDYVIEDLPLLAGTYLVSATIYDFDGEHAYDYIHQRYLFKVRPGGVREQYGSFHIPATWRWNPG